VTALLDAPPAGSAPAAAGAEQLSWVDRLVTPLPADRLRGWVVTLLIGGLAAYMRFHALGKLLWLRDPNNNKITGYLTGTYVDSGGCVRYYQDIFDETYYHHDSLSLLHHGVESDCTNTMAGFVVHPPLGKWSIAAGIKLFGDTPFGWRFSCALAGTLAVIVMIRLARRMFGSTLLGAIAGLLMSLDGLEFVQSRVGILDIFLMFFELVALACLVLDRDWGRRRLAERLDAGASNAFPGPRIGFRPWRLATAVFLGAALAVKWDGLYVIPAVAALAFAWDVGLRRSARIPAPVRATIRKDWLGWLPTYILVPTATYTATWTGWFLSSNKWAWDRSNFQSQATGVTYNRSGFFGSIKNWLSYQCDAYNFHKNLTDNNHITGGVAVPLVNFCRNSVSFHQGGTLHPYLSKPWSWFFLSRPVALYYQAPPQGVDGCHTSLTQGGCSSEILDIGTPLIWWAALPALVVVIGLWFAWRDWRAAMILVVFAATFFPWVLFESRQMFFFYALTCLPLIVLALTMVAGLALGPPGASLVRRRWGGAAVGTYMTFVAINFFFLLPILVGTTLSSQHWHWRIWFPGWV
jgi:dolichyl-phosphate-mannose-protein mannosyltransferase